MGTDNSTSIKIPQLPHFNMSQFMGKWYEIARLCEVNQDEWVNNTMELKKEKKGRITLISRQYHMIKQMWKVRKYRVKEMDVKNYLKISTSILFPDKLKVGFVDEEYSIALLTARNNKSLWLVAREEHISDEKLEQQLQVIEQLGFDRSTLHYTQQKVTL